MARHKGQRNTNVRIYRVTTKATALVKATTKEKARAILAEPLGWGKQLAEEEQPELLSAIDMTTKVKWTHMERDVDPDVLDGDTLVPEND